MSGAFQVLMIGVAVAGLAAVVWAWPRAGGRGGRSVAGRLGLLAGSQVLVVAACLVVLNGYFGFVSTWSQVLGTDRAPVSGPGPSASARAPRQPSLLVNRTEPGPDPRGRLLTAAARAGRETGARTRPGPAVTGRLLQVSMTGPRTGITVHGDYVYLPPQYYQRAYARDEFPVVLALTGYPGSAWTLAARLGLPAQAARLVAAGRLPPAVYVLMGSGPALPRDTECTNIPAGPQVETFFAQDVPELIEAHFRVQTGAAGWSALGYSTGGYCAAKLAMFNPYQFRLAVSVAGYYVALRDDTTGNLYGGSLGYRHENDLDWRLRNLPAPPVSLLVTSSRVGEDSYPGTLAFLKLVRPPMRAYSLILPAGGHNYGTWTRELPQCLAWLGARLAPPAPAPPGA
jgi:S-formylglutathione hydrolase FrmB